MSDPNDRDVILFGGGGHAKVIVAALRQAGRRVTAIYDDDVTKTGTSVAGVPVVGPTSSAPCDVPAVIAIGDNAARKRVAAQDTGRPWATVIHPRAEVDPSASIGPGSVIFAGAVVQADAVVGPHSIVNTGATIDHDCAVSDFAHIGPGVHLAGGVHVGHGTFLGIGSAAVPHVRIGDWTTVGAGGVVTGDLPDHVVATGIPARPTRTATAGGATVQQSTAMPESQTNRAASQGIVPFAPWPAFAEDEIEAAVAVLRSGKVNYWTGDEGRQFEAEFAAIAGCRHAIAVANGTLALELALYTLGVGPGDEVIVPSRTFIASASCVVARGATPVIADVDRASQNLTSETVEAVLSPKTKGIVAVHLAGWPCEMDALMSLARKHGLYVIEDCAQAIGAEYRGRPVGSHGDIAAFSFCQDKILTTGGEGGMLTTNDKSLWERAWSYKDHGKSWDAVYHRQHPGVFKWLHESFGTNFRMTEMQAAMGRVALRKLPGWVQSRERYARVLNEALAEVPALRLTLPPAWLRHSYYKYYAFLRLEKLSADWNRDRIVRTLQDEGIPCGSGCCSEIYLEAAFRKAGLGPADRLPVAQELGETSLVFLVHPTLSDAAIKATADAIKRVVGEASGLRPSAGPGPSIASAR
jgi:sugar O-acyltransferase (sialic acid O-acetyltransferase NeuD family)